MTPFVDLGALIRSVYLALKVPAPMKLHFLLALLFAALSACEPPLPDGAFREDTGGGGGMPGGSPVDAGREDVFLITPSMTGGGTENDAAVGLVGGGDAGVSGGVSGMGGQTGGSDAGTGPLSEQAQRLQRLAGRYLMRMDMLSTVSVPQVTGPVKTSNRISHLSVVELARDGETIVANERLCHQTYQHRCLENSCTSVTTTMSPRVVDQLLGVPLTKRVFTFKGNDFSTDMPTQYLGFDAKTNPALPTSNTDQRVWDTVSGGQREGLLLSLTARASLISISCDTYNVQSFAARFSGTALGSDGFPSLLNKTFTLKTTTEATTLASNSRDCQPGKDNATSQVGNETVRFAAVAPEEFAGDLFWRCPDVSAWDKRLAAPAP